MKYSQTSLEIVLTDIGLIDPIGHTTEQRNGIKSYDKMNEIEAIEFHRLWQIAGSNHLSCSGI